jgi:hypothetical protein
MKAGSPSKMSVSSFQPEALNLQLYRCENPKSYNGSSNGVHTLRINLPHFWKMQFSAPGIRWLRHLVSAVDQTPGLVQDVLQQPTSLQKEDYL